MNFDPDGWPLREAVMRTADQDTLATIHRAMCDLTARDFLFEPPGWWCLQLAPLPGASIAMPGAALSTLVYQVEREFQRQLSAGELACTARSETLERVALPADIWSIVTIDWTDECLHVGRISFYAPRIARACTSEVDPYRTGLPGRPTKKHFVEQEFLRRAGAGEALETLEGEARALHLWASREHPDGPPLSVRSIENNIRAAYRAHKNKRTA